MSETVVSCTISCAHFAVGVGRNRLVDDMSAYLNVLLRSRPVALDTGTGIEPVSLRYRPFSFPSSISSS